MKLRSLIIYLNVVLALSACGKGSQKGSDTQNSLAVGNLQKIEIVTDHINGQTTENIDLSVSDPKVSVQSKVLENDPNRECSGVRHLTPQEKQDLVMAAQELKVGDFCQGASNIPDVKDCTSSRITFTSADANDWSKSVKIAFSTEPNSCDKDNVYYFCSEKAIAFVKMVNRLKNTDLTCGARF